MKILIISYYWPPAGGSGVQRWLKFVKYLVELGHEPIIHTPENPDYPVLDTSLENEIPYSVKVVKHPIWEPNHVLQKFSKKGKQSSAGFLGKNQSLSQKILTYIRANYFIPDARKFWIKPSVKFLKEHLTHHQGVDAIVTTGPPHSMHLIGLGLKKEFPNLQWVADFRDPWTKIDYFEQLPLNQKAKAKHFELENRVLEKADKILVVGETMKSWFVETNKDFQDKIEVITNGYDTENTASETKPNLDREFSITHIGMLNADRNPHILWESLVNIKKSNPEDFKDFNIKLIGKTAPEVKKSIQEKGLNSIVTFIDYLPHQEVKQHQQNSQVLLLAVNDVPSAKCIITGKIFEYLQAKRPILAIAPTDGDLAKILEQTQAGEVYDFKDIKGFTSALLKLYADFTSEQGLQIHSKNIEQYHRKALTKQLITVLEK